MALSLTRQKLPIITTPEAAADGVARGGYVLGDSALDTLDIILIATGSEVSLALEAQTQLAVDGIGARVVSLPSWELFEAQPAGYRETILPKGITKRLSVEAGVTIGWQRYVGLDGASVGVDRFGASAPYKVLADAYGLTAANIVAKVKELLSA